MIGSELGITPSGVVYLNGEQFVEAAKMVGETLLASGVKVKSRELAEMLYAVALLAMEADGVLRLELVQRKRLLGLTKAPAVAVIPLRAAAIGGLEGAILHAVTPDPTRNDLAEVIYRQIGQDMADPWEPITTLVKRDLAPRGFIQEQREARRGLGKILGDKVTLLPVPERIAAVRGLVAPLKELLASRQAEKPERAAQLWKDLRKGFQRRVEQQDSDTE